MSLLSQGAENCSTPPHHLLPCLSFREVHELLPLRISFPSPTTVPACLNGSMASNPAVLFPAMTGLFTNRSTAGRLAMELAIHADISGESSKKWTALIPTPPLDAA